MPKSKVRGGAKAHRAKVQSRNQKINSAKSAMQKLFNEAIAKEVEEMKKKEQEQAQEQSSEILDDYEVEQVNTDK